MLKDKTIASQLRKVNPDGVLAWTFTYEGGVTTSSPKVWPFGQTVHILAQVEDLDTSLVIVDSSGALVRQEAVTSCPHVVTGGSEIWDAIANFLEVLSEIPSEFDPASLDRDIPEQFGWLTPTVAVVSREGSNEAGVVVTDRCDMVGLRWQPPALEEIWSVDVGDEPRHVSGRVCQRPAGPRRRGGDLRLRRQDGRGDVAPRDGRSGDGHTGLLRTPDLRRLAPRAPCPGRRRLAPRQPLGKEQTAASVALSGNLGYLSSTGGLDTFTFDLVTVLSNGSVPGPLSSPVIAEDGTVYAISGESLFAFAP